MIKDIWVESDVMTLEWCMTKCRGGNHTFAGLEHYRHCFCGDSYDESVYPKKAESECNTPCTGNPQQMCGGVWRLSMFRCR
ncbi:kremen protein 1-like [Haliotis rufescens]|uniref:kremen protein 1-like n=1 Tax=Haliotis rufescens TaxID=6454 RepID=UPI00201F4D39|nr:kremen protein 1-like [Haliotis rufescens]